MHRPAITAATQNSAGAGGQHGEHRHHDPADQRDAERALVADAVLHSSRSANAPSAAAMLTRKTSIIVSVCLKPSTCSAYTAASAMTTAMPAW